MDERLVREVQEGDAEAFRSLVVANHARMLRVAQGVLRDPHVAEDAVQQAFLDIWRDIRRLRDASKFEGWSYKLLLRVCYAEAKRLPRWVPDSQIPAAAEPRVGDVFGVVVDRDQLSRGFQHLSTDHRAVIVLRYLMDLTSSQVLIGDGDYEGLYVVAVLEESDADAWIPSGYIFDGDPLPAPEPYASE